MLIWINGYISFSQIQIQEMNQNESDFYYKDETHNVQFDKTHKLSRLQTLKPPFSKLCRIVCMDLMGNQMQIGTGCLINERVVLTCFHNVLDPSRKIFPLKQIRVFIGQNGKKQQSYECKIASIKYNHDGFYKGKGIQRKKNDYAILLLEQNPDLTTIKPSEILSYSIPSLDKQDTYKFQLYGYDSDLNQQHCRQKGVPLNSESHLFGCMFDNDHISEDFIYYRVSTASGKSGAPIIRYSQKGIFKSIGIHLGQSERQIQDQKTKTNYALRINDSVVKNIKKWLDQWQKQGYQINNFNNPHTSKLYEHSKDSSGKTNAEAQKDLKKALQKKGESDLIIKEMSNNIMRLRSDRQGYERLIVSKQKSLNLKEKEVKYQRERSNALQSQTQQLHKQLMIKISEIQNYQRRQKDLLHRLNRKQKQFKEQTEIANIPQSKSVYLSSYPIDQ